MSPTVSHRSDTDQLALIYGKGKDGATPVRDKSQLVESLQIGAFDFGRYLTRRASIERIKDVRKGCTPVLVEAVQKEGRSQANRQ
jgi:hypothetical protein